MKDFKEFLAFDELDEGVASSATVLAYARKSKAAGDAAVRAAQKGRGELKQGKAADTTQERLTRLTAALDASLEAQMATRSQIGNLVAALVAAQVMKRTKRR